MSGGSASTMLQYTGIGAFVAIFLYAVLYYSRSFQSDCLTRRGDAADADLTAAGTGGAATAPALPGPVQALGLGPEDVAVLPTFTYHAASPGHGVAKVATAAAAECCAVCLDELREGALVRMLPSCKHYFHADCVDVWLLSHATCPVCRRSPGPEMVRLGVASMSPPLPQLRRCGAASPESGEASGAEDAVPSRSPSPVRSPSRFEVLVAVGNGSWAMSQSPTRPRAPEGGMCCTRSASPMTLEPHGFEV
ncbi:hypothetical protein ACP70R_043155 [Stipagrostis hirtigluma subsp. patula]